nr:RNA-directed DNA polymerase, eukaryota [Tanacetum cinerariifolium]
MIFAGKTKIKRQSLMMACYSTKAVAGRRLGRGYCKVDLGKVYTARAKELFTWTPIFLDHKEFEYISDDESLHGAKNKAVGSQHEEDDLVDDSDVEGVSETFFGGKHPSPNNNVCNISEKVVEQQSEDLFCIYDLLNKKPKCVAQDSDSSLSHPPGFTPTPEVSRQDNDHRGVDLNTETDKVNSPLVHTKVMNNSQKVHENVTSNGESAFNYSHNAHNGGSILEVLNDMIWVGQSIGYAMEGCMKDIEHIIGTQVDAFKKDYATVFDNFIAIYGTWISNNSKVLIVIIYAHQSLSHKRVLWDYISSMIARWSEETIVMGDFNEVRSIDKRFGSMFNRSSSRLFNHFNTSSGIMDVKFEGYSFTWAHPSATKMSKLYRFLVLECIISLFPSITALCLDRHLSDHQPIFLREIHTDYGPIPFYFYHSWFKWDGFDVMKSKIKWAIEEDENSKFFHGIINKKRSQVSIREVFVHGDWNTDPEVVKDVFKDHFATRFKQPAHGRLKLNISFPNRLSTDQVADMDRSVSRDKIRVAVWNCGENKSPGPDGGSFLKGSNSSFIALIPKVTDVKFVTDFRPISLIGCVYKVVTKILANRLATVISDLVFDIQSAFVANRQILDRPFILNELLAWCKRKKKQALIFKVDFAKAYDSVHWDYLLDVLQDFGFGPNWCKLIRGTFSFAMASILVNGSPTFEFPFLWAKTRRSFGVVPFILIIESLHISFSRATSDGLFKGIQIQGSMAISHLFYVDDAIFIGEWSDSNLDNIVKILKCFFLASGLKINIRKSQVLGVGVPRNIVNQAASLIGCAGMQNPFRYLGVMVEIVCLGNLLGLTRFKSYVPGYPSGRLKLSLLERSDVIFNGVDPAERKITWVSWGKVLASMKNSGLGVSSFHALNRALLLKWWDDLNSVLGSVTLSASKDRWICDLNSDGVFRVKERKSVFDFLSTFNPLELSFSGVGTVNEIAQGSAYNRDLQTWACLADFRCVAKVSSENLSSVLLLPDCSQFDVRCALTQEALNAFFNTFHIPEEVHSVLPNQDNTMHERPAGKIRYGPVFIHPRHRSYQEASVDRLFDEGGSGHQIEQGDSTRGGQDVNIQPVVEAADTIAKEAAHMRSRHDHGTPSGTSVGGKSRSSLQRFPAEAVLNAEVGVTVVPTLPFVIASVSTMPEREDEDHTDFVTEHNLRTIRAPQRFVISSDSSHHSGPTVAEAGVDFLIGSSIPIMTTATTVTSMVDSALVAKEKTVKPFLFSVDSSSAGGADPNAGVFSNLTRSDFLVGGIRTVINAEYDLQKTYVPLWSVINGSRLDDGRVCREMVDEFALPKFFASVRGMEHDQLFTEFYVEAASQMSLSAEVRMQAEYNVKEKRRLKSVVEKKDELLKARDEEIENLKARMLLKDAEAAEAICLQRNTILEKKRNALDVKAADLEASVMDKERQLTNLNVHLTAVKSPNDVLVDQVHELEVSSAGLQEKLYSYENLTERLEEFQDAQLKIVNDKLDKLWLLTHGVELALVKCLHSPEYLSTLGAAIKKGMQDGLSAGIIHGKEGRVLTDLGLTELQPHVDQLMVLIHHSPNKVVVGASALSLALDVSSIRVQKIWENIANHRSALCDVFVLLAKPFSVVVLTGGCDGNAEPFPNVDDAKLNIPHASVTLYGPSHLGPGFPVSFARLASLLRYTRSTSAVLGVGMPISARMTASVPYVNENGVSPFLDFIMAAIFSFHQTISLRVLNRSKVLPNT